MKFKKARSTAGYGGAWKSRAANRIKKVAETLGFDAGVATARTGTLYITLSRDLPTGHSTITADSAGKEIWLCDTEELQVRVADHAECYCSEDFSVDPCGASPAQAIEWIESKGAIPNARPNTTHRLPAVGAGKQDQNGIWRPIPSNPKH